MEEIEKRKWVTIQRIINIIYEKGKIHIRGIAKQLDVKPGNIVYYIDNYLIDFLDEERIELGGFKLRFLSMKRNGITILDVKRNKEVKKQIKGDKNVRKATILEKQTKD